MIKVALVVPFYNDWERLGKLISSYYSSVEISRNVLAEKDIKVNLVAIDNDSNKPKPNLEVLKCKDIVWLNETEKGSYSARNKGIRDCSADYYYFTDSDCLLDPSLLENLANILPLDNDCKIIGGKVEIFQKEEGKETIFEAFDMITGLDQRRYISRGSAITANLLVPNSVIKKIGCFDTSRFSGGDSEFAERALSAAVKLEYDEALVVHHPARESLHDFASKVKRISGAQIQKLGRLKGTIFIPYSFMVFFKEFRLSISSSNTLKFKFKAILGAGVVLVLRLMYLGYFISGGENLQR